MNGQTGKLAGDKPVSGWRIALAVIAAAALVFTLALLFGLFGGR